jgi:FkbM family methyltransferase
LKLPSTAQLVNAALGTVGLSLHRSRAGSERQSLYGALQHVRDLGLSPRSVIDVGAAYGTPELYEVFADARHLLIEPLGEYRPYLDRVRRTHPHTEYALAAATSRPGPVTIHVHADLVGSSAYLETEDSPGLNDTPRSVPGITLDGLCAERRVEGPYLIKVDVQGAELDVLSGATQILAQTEYIVLETSLFGFYRDGVQLYDVMAFMHERGFVAYDLVGRLYRPLDGALAQVDLAFVKQNGSLRSHHAYATPGQRAAQTQHLLGDAPWLLR